MAELKSFGQPPIPPSPSGSVPGSSSPALLGPQLPVVDLIGLRFSLAHLRLSGYGLLAVWLAEMVTMLNASDLLVISSRLHYTSQFLDLSPILLAAIGLIAYQGGVRRRIWELVLLPPLLCLLLLLSALHLFLAPMTVANAATLVQKQEEIGLEQMQRIDRQIDRAAAILRESDSIDSLLEGLQRIPGLQVRLQPNAPVLAARREVRLSLERDRDRLRERIRNNLSTSRDAFIRRAATNAALALLVGLVLWGLHRGAMREMQQSVPFLEWVLVHGDGSQSQDVLRELLRFQRACLALGWFSMLERSLGLMRRMVRPGAEEVPMENLPKEAREDLFPPAPYPPSFEVGRLAILGTQRSPLFPSLRLGEAGPPPFEPEDDGLPSDGASLHPVGFDWNETGLPFWRRWWRKRQRRLARQALRRQGESQIFLAFQGTSSPPASAVDGAQPLEPGSGQDPPPADPHALTPAQLRGRLRDLKRSRRALGRLAQPEFLEMIGQQAPPPPAPPSPRLQRKPTGLAWLWRWFVTHL
jgi:hypothetical protein